MLGKGKEMGRGQLYSKEDITLMLMFVINMIQQDSSLLHQPKNGHTVFFLLPNYVYCTLLRNFFTHAKDM